MAKIPRTRFLHLLIGLYASLLYVTIGLIFTRATLASVGRPIAVVVCLSVRPSVAGFCRRGINV